MTRRLLELDGIRGLAVFIVFLSHTSGRSQAATNWLEFHGVGLIGVYIFFVLSGFLLTTNLLYEKEKYGFISLKNFYIRRFFRIAPLYYFVISMVFLRQFMTGEVNDSYLHIQNGFSGFLRHLLFIQGDSVFWTIPTEVAFYMILPFIVLYIFKFGRRAIEATLFLTVIFSIWTLVSIGGVIEAGLAPKLVQIKYGSQFVEVFLCGTLMAVCYNSGIIKCLLNNKSFINACTFFIMLLIVLCLVLISNNFLGFSRPMYEFRWFSLLFGVAFSIMIVVSISGGLLNKIFKQRWLRYMGIVGFSWYLVHFEVLKQVNTLQVEPYQKLILSFICCAVLSGALFFLIEKPFMSLAKKITAHSNRHPSETKLFNAE